jgi:hypothetical protein
MVAASVSRHLLLTVLWLALATQTGAGVQSPQDLVDRAEASFARGQFAESVADFDRLTTMAPSVAPLLWPTAWSLRERSCQYGSLAACRADATKSTPTDAKEGIDPGRL